MDRKDFDHLAGCLLGGAAGDALGAPVEFESLTQIRSRFGPAGISDMREAVGKDSEGLARFTDDTQMTLFTAEGLLRARNRLAERGEPATAAVVHNAYFRWLYTQGSGTGGLEGQVDGWLITLPGLFATRAPGYTCMSALRSGVMGTPEVPVNHSKGCGGVMRAAPAGLLSPPSEAFSTGCAIAALTHGHTSGYLAAGFLASVISSIIEGASLDDAIARASDDLAGWPGHEECLEAIGRAVELARDASSPRTPETIETLGEGWVAEEALAMSLYAALCYPGDFPSAVCLAVNHDGDSDSTGSIAGNIVGALQGMSGIPAHWLKLLEMYDDLTAITADMLESLQDGSVSMEKYPPW
jgi:ADP-ribosyl-[dinitrogen reductase] hydrolase